MTDKIEIDDWIKCMIEDENKFHQFYSVENKSVNIYIFFISGTNNVSSVEKIKVELIDGVLMWDKLSGIISSYKQYEGNKYSYPKIGVYNIDITTKPEVLDFISTELDADNKEDGDDGDDDDDNDDSDDDGYYGSDGNDEMFKYWRFVKLDKDIRFKDSIGMFGRLNSIYMFFNEDTNAV